MTNGPLQVVSLGRANLDLFSQDIGAPFEEITGFDAMVGGSPTNIAIGLSRLGVSAAVLGAVGTDRVGDFVLRYLRDEGVVTDFMPRKEGKLTSLALLGVQPPSDFPLSFYREDPADIYLDEDDVAHFPLQTVAAAQISGNALSRGPCATAAARFAAMCREASVETYMDLDLRPTEWSSPEGFGQAIRAVLHHIDVVIGTEEEYFAALADDPAPAMDGSQVPPGELDGLDRAIRHLTAESLAMAVVKRGPRGATVHTAEGTMDIGGFPIDVVNTVGAGDSFAAGLIRSRLAGLDTEHAVRFANACGAIVVSRHGCSVALPSEAEVNALIASGSGR